MGLKLSEFKESHGKEVCSWKYEGQYSIYNFPQWDIVVKNNWAITNKEKREKEFLSVLDVEDNYCGYVRLQDKGDHILIGLGLKPSSCGHGLGRELMEILIDYCHENYPDKKLSLEVRGFNKRAIKCYERAGFKVVKTYHKDTPIGPEEFIYMEYLLH